VFLDSFPVLLLQECEPVSMHVYFGVLTITTILLLQLSCLYV